MVTFLCGSAGSGKSTEIAKRILDDLKHGIPVILLVPEQMAISAERRLTDLALSSPTPIPTDGLEILNFTRLANRVFRTEGGISYHSIGVGGRTLIMYRALAQTAPYLSEYRSALVTPENFAQLMLGAVQEMQIFGVTPAMMDHASAELREDFPSLSGKLKDLALISQTYRHLLTTAYDDPLDELPRLAEILRKKNLFEGYHIYFDSFNGLTPQEYEITALLFQQAVNVVFSVCLPPEYQGVPAFASIADMYQRLKNLTAEDCEVLLSDTPRYTSHALAFVSKYLWTDAPAPSPDCGNAVRVIECSNLYSQAEEVALDIARRVQEDGCRFRDFAVVCGDATRYAGVLDSYFDRYGIPFFFSLREDMTRIPLIKLILTLLSIKQYAWRCEDVTNLLKTGLTPLTEDESDLLESYANTWDIHGDRWTDEYEWTMHPRGYLRDFTPQDTELLARLNDIRPRLCTQILDFTDQFQIGVTVKEISTVLYRFLLQFGVREKLAAFDPSRAALIWNTVMDALDELVAVCGDMAVDAELYTRLFTIQIRESDIGRLPATVDETVIGSASLLRAEEIKHVYLIGANDGEFPEVSSENSIFSDSDKIALESVGIEISSTSRAKSEDGLFHFWRAASTPSVSLTVLYVRSTLKGEVCKPSLGVSRLFALFPALCTIHPEQEELRNRLLCPKADFGKLPRLMGTAEGEALFSWYRAKPEYAQRLSSLNQPICLTEENLSSETAAILYPGNLTLSQTHLEDYVHCAFGYHCKHVLRLQPSRPAMIRPTDTGSFVHHILDRFFRAVRTKDGIRTDLEEEEIVALTESIILDYLSGIFGGNNRQNRQSGRLMALFRRLKRATLIVIRNLLDEFRHSSFVPTFFEMPIAFSAEDNAVPPIAIPLSSGGFAYVVGRIDRVDTYKKGKDVYIRVVDYKTGSKSFSVSDLSIGLNMQLMLYLYAIWNRATPQIRHAMDISGDGTILPAGILYCQAKPQTVSLDMPVSKEESDALLSSGGKRSGMLLNDEEILRAMDDTEGMRFLPISFNKDGSVSSYTLRAETLQTLEQFGARIKSISAQVETIASEIKRGNCSVLPLREQATQIDACRFCEMKAVCRNFRTFRTPKRQKEGEPDHV